MRYLSTRAEIDRVDDVVYHTNPDLVSISEAIEQGLAPDGGLYVPTHFVRPEGADHLDLGALPEVGEWILAPYFEDDRLADDLAGICRAAFDFPIPLRRLKGTTSVLELFHGPTAAFKDIGARFLAESLSRLAREGDRPLTILTATSGDTGGAVAAAFHGRPGVEVVVLYPKGMVSPRQERQLTVWGGNVRALAVHGDFDDCQRLVKEAFADPALTQTHHLTSANSINIGRLLPQMVYYAAAALEYEREFGVEPGVIVPTGNLGNAVAALWAQRSGIPIREVVIATNENRPIVDFLAGAEWCPRPTVPTLATAMDVGSPSNMERVFHLFGDEDAVRRELRAFLISDDEIRDQIRHGPDRWGEVWDPHTATAVAVRERIGGDDWIVVSTAHPAKFEGVVEPLIGRRIPIPGALAELLDQPMQVTELEPELEALRDYLQG